MDFSKKVVAGMIAYNNLRLLMSKDHCEKKLLSVKVMTHAIDSICYPAALVYIPFDIIYAEKYVRSCYGDPYLKNETYQLLSFGTILTSQF